MCTIDADCVDPSRPCDIGTCLGTLGCTYERKPLSECCVDTSECAPFERPEIEQLECIDNCCTSTPNFGDSQCSVDADCRAYARAAECQSDGKCFELVCNDGWCECQDTLVMDRDGDGKPCATDCDDQNSTIRDTIDCFVDADGDGFPNCLECQVLCVEPGATCPVGYVSFDASLVGAPQSTTFVVLDKACTTSAHADKVQRISTSTLESELSLSTLSASTKYSFLDFFHSSDDDDDSSRSSDDDDDSSSSSSSSTSPASEDICDCCDSDPFAFPGSHYAFIHPNECWNFDYNCDNVRTTYACCEDGAPVGEPVAHGPTNTLSEHRRIAWDIDVQQCTRIPTGPYTTDDDDDAAHCGGCVDLYPDTGWACQADCDASVAKRSLKNCPTVCGGQCACIDSESPPLPGECGDLITGCDRAEHHLFYSLTDCCVATVN